MVETVGNELKFLVSLAKPFSQIVHPRFANLQWDALDIASPEDFILWQMNKPYLIDQILLAIALGGRASMSGSISLAFDHHDEIAETIKRLVNTFAR